MITVANAEEAVAGIPDGATVTIGGFGHAGQPLELIGRADRTGRQRSDHRQQRCRKRRHRGSLRY